MSAPKELLAKQKTLMGLIRRAMIDFNKIAKKDLTLATLQNRTKKSENYWDQFLSQLGEVEATADDGTRRSDNYCIRNIFSATQDCYNITSDFCTENICSICQS